MNFELIFSIGPACRPAYYLKQHFLRLFACPLDYQMSYSLDTCLHLFQSSFEDFFINIEEDSTKKGANNNRRVIDIKNNIISIHHFSCDKPLYEEQHRFRSMMLKRYYNLHTAILHAKTVGILCNRDDSIEDLTSFLLSFGKIYPHTKFVLINMRNNPSLTSIEENDYYINSTLCIKEYSFCDSYQATENSDYELNKWVGNVEIWNSILNNFYIINHPFAKYIKSNISSNESVLIYGAGNYCHKILNFLSIYNINTSNIIVSSLAGNPTAIDGITVLPFSDIPKEPNNQLIIISIVDQIESLKVYNLLKEFGFQFIIRIDSFLRPLH